LTATEVPRALRAIAAVPFADQQAAESSLIGILKETIRASGLSLNELWERTGVSNPQLSWFMRGEG